MTCASWLHPCKAQAWLTRQSRDGDWSKRRGLLICRVLVSLACRRCNRGERGKSYRVPSARLVARLHERNNWLVDSHHPLREPIILQTGVDADRRASFLRGRRQVAVDALIHERGPTIPSRTIASLTRWPLQLVPRVQYQAAPQRTTGHHAYTKTH